MPDLALKRGLGRDLVVAPYASALAAQITPQRAIANLGTLERQGGIPIEEVRRRLGIPRRKGLKRARSH